MLSATEARTTILSTVSRYDVERVPLADATGRVLRQPVTAERDQPPFNRVTMDGIALRHSDYAAGTVEFRIVATQHAGDPVQPLDGATSCAEVMTGAVLPEGADTVIPVERISVKNGMATLEDGYTPEARQFVHHQGSDHRSGRQVLSEGNVIAPVDIAVIASCGLAEVNVSRSPIVRIISTGNELVAAGAPIKDHQIRLSNGPAMAAMLAQSGFRNTTSDHIPDSLDELEKRIGQHLDEADVLVLSGGVSMGKADFVPEVLAKLGVEVVFHKISQRPGKPMWFGTGPSGQAVFALPGNPVSALVCCRQYVLPALFAASGRLSPDSVNVLLDAPISFGPKLTYFLPVRLRSGEDGTLSAVPAPTNTSGDFTALSRTDGFVELEAERDDFPVGAVVPFHAWQNP